MGTALLHHTSRYSSLSTVVPLFASFYTNRYALCSLSIYLPPLPASLLPTTHLLRHHSHAELGLVSPLTREIFDNNHGGPTPYQPSVRCAAAFLSPSVASLFGRPAQSQCDGPGLHALGA